MTAFPRTDTPDCRFARRYREPAALGWRDDVLLTFCGHFDGHDVYRRFDFETYVVVWENSEDAVAEIQWSSAAFWLSNNPDETEWGTMRAIVKGRRSLVERLDECVRTLRFVFFRHPDTTPKDWPQGIAALTCDVADDAAEWIETLRKGVGL